MPNSSEDFETQTIKILRRPAQLRSLCKSGEKNARPIKTLEQREKEYAEARMRIFGEAKNPLDVFEDAQNENRNGNLKLLQPNGTMTKIQQNLMNSNNGMQLIPSYSNSYFNANNDIAFQGQQTFEQNLMQSQNVASDFDAQAPESVVVVNPMFQKMISVFEPQLTESGNNPMLTACSWSYE